MNTLAIVTIASCLGAYLLGSVPVGLLIGRWRGVDIRAHGSGNIGATNVGRVLGRRFGLACFALDFAKGMLPSASFGVWLTRSLAEGTSLGPPEILAWLGVAASAIIGHVFPVWLGFKGGKGVATSAGALLGVFPVLSLAMLIAAMAWVVSARTTRMVGISSCIAASVLPLGVLFVPKLAGLAGLTMHNTGSPPGSTTVAWPYLVVTTLLAGLVVSLHRGNIARTIAGTEPRIGERAHPSPGVTPGRYGSRRA